MDDARDALATALAAGLEYTGLRGFEVDPRLFAYVPRDLALRERVVPILLVGDTLKIASSTPEPDLSLIRSRFPYVALDIVLAPAAEIDAALRRADVQA